MKVKLLKTKSRILSLTEEDMSEICSYPYLYMDAGNVSLLCETFL